MSEFRFQEMLPLGEDETPYRLLTKDGVRVRRGGAALPRGRARGAHGAHARGDARHRAPAAARAISRSSGAILEDPEASPNDRFVALDLLKNANIAAGGVLPMCQDTGTAIVHGQEGPVRLHRRRRRGGDRARRLRHLRRRRTCATRRSRRSTCTRRRTRARTCPRRSRSTRPTATRTSSSSWRRAAARRTRATSIQETKALLNPTASLAFLDEKLRALGTAACPPYHLAIVIGGTSAEHTLKVAKLASRALPRLAPDRGQRARARLPRPRARGARCSSSRSAPASARSSAASTSATTCASSGCRATARAARSASRSRARPTGRRSAKITADGVFLEQLERDPAKYLPDTTHEDLARRASSRSICAGR